MAPIGKIYSYPNNPRTFKILIAAEYNSLEVEVAEFEFGKDNKDPKFLENFHHEKVPAFESADGDLHINECGAIAYYVSSCSEKTQLLGKNQKETAKVLSYILFAENEIIPHANTWINPILGITQYNKAAHNQSTEGLKKSLNVLEKILLKKTYLVGERVTLADISVATALYLPFKLVLDAKFREGYKNLTRWYKTVVNQPAFKKVLGEVILVDVAHEYTPPKKDKPKKETKAREVSEEKSDKKKEEAPDDLEEEEAKPAPKPKSKLDSLPPTKLNLEEWKRFYSNNNTRPDAINWFWEHYDPEGYSIWRVDYKYNEELTKVFMSSNLIGGFFNRLERARKYAFGSLVVLGEDNKNEIAGYFVIRGQEIPEEVTDAADFESYEFKKVDHADPKERSCFEDYIAWDGHLDGKKFADGKIFK
ncbi:EF1G-domain-containing protein [Gigaspora margarita]|uniref:EF1G-domain-containing protein n=1 Tax=Gigaspora margarita TaxID=4874 RepID=A0A8H3X051_GIGMA|nr:EF1G-domain-containing protein [Gigaspora margarita]